MCLLPRCLLTSVSVRRRGRIPLDSSRDTGILVSNPTPVRRETSPKDERPMEVLTPPEESMTPPLRDRASDGASRGPPGDERPKGGGKTSKVNNPKGGDNSGSSRKPGGSAGIISSYRQRFQNISSKISPPNNKSKK